MATERIDSDQARELIAGGEAQVIDIRNREEFGEIHIPGARPVADADADALADELDEGSKVLVVCEDGERSASLAAELRERGIEASAIDGGMKSWAGDGLPSQPSEDFEEEPAEPPKLPGAGV